MAQLTFLGGTNEVTGSCYLVETEETRFLVDCGMFQGGSEAEIKNRSAFSFDPETIDFVLLTHAHIDHSGLLPRLSARGFRGPVYTTGATIDLLKVMLKDSAYIQEKEVEWKNKILQRKQHVSEYENAPLYTVTQAEIFLKQLCSIAYDEKVFPHPTIQCCFRDAGHILGSAIVEVWIKTQSKQKKLVFSGDIGQPGHPVVQDPTLIHQADVLLVESTYGNRLHRSMVDTIDELTYAVNDTLLRKGGNIIVPAFSVGRTQELLFLLIDLHRQNKLGKMDIYVDSPMAKAATDITLQHSQLLDKEAHETLQWFNKEGNPLKINFTENVEDSIALNAIDHGAIIISASGMCDAGRIKYHLKYNLPRPECTILITGFQAAGTLGRRLVDGAKIVRIFGQEIVVRSDLYTIGGLSAHADQAGILNWLKAFKTPPNHTYIVHGEPSNANALANIIKQQLNWPVSIPERFATVTL